MFNKFKDFVGLNEPDDYEDYYDEEEMDTRNESAQPPSPAPEAERSPRARSRERNYFTSDPQTTPSPKSNVIGMPGTNNGLNEIVVIEPQSFEKMPEVIQALRERKTVLLNLNMMEPDDAQRAVDFVAGGTYAIDGNQERVGESIFLFTPNCVTVTSRSHSTPAISTAQGGSQGNLSQMNAPTASWHKQGNAIAQ